MSVFADLISEVDCDASEWDVDWRGDGRWEGRGVDGWVEEEGGVDGGGDAVGAVSESSSGA